MLNDIYFVPLKAAQTAASSEVESDKLDISNYDGVMLITNVASAAVEAYQYDGTDSTKVKTVTVTSSTQTAVVIDLYRPQEELGEQVYVKIDREESAVTGPIYAIAYHGRVKPIDNDSSDADLPVSTEVEISPSEES